MDCAPVIASLYATLQDFASAEDIAQEVFIAAWQQWPVDGIPDNPRHWLLKVARHKALDFLRRSQVRNRFSETVNSELFSFSEPVDVSFTSDADEMLNLLWVTCHPKLTVEQQSALILSSFFGLTSAVIARLFFTSDATIKKRIQRAKDCLRTIEALEPLSAQKRLESQLNSVLNTLYVMFKQGYAPVEGAQWMNRELAEFAMRMTRILAGMVKDNADVLGLLALMEFQFSRFRARYHNGLPVLFEHQDRRLWDHTLIHHAQHLIKQMLQLLLKNDTRATSMVLQALIAQCYSVAPKYTSIDWAKIEFYYQHLLTIAYSPLIHLNYTIVLSERYGADVALTELNELAREPTLQRYHYFHAVKADYLIKLNRLEDAKEALASAIGFATNQAEKKMLEQKRRELTGAE